MYLIFNSSEERDLFYEQIVQQPGICTRIVFLKSHNFIGNSFASITAPINKSIKVIFQVLVRTCSDPWPAIKSISSHECNTVRPKCWYIMSVVKKKRTIFCGKCFSYITKTAVVLLFTVFIISLS